MDNHERLANPKPILVVDLFQETLDSLLNLLSGLTNEEWGNPTTCSGWSVKDVALHLLRVEIGNLSSRRDLYSSGPRISDWENLVKRVNSMNEKWIEAARGISTQLLIELLGFVGPKVYDHYGSLDPLHIGGSVSWAGNNPQPVWLDIAREYTERWHHQQHIREAVNQPGLKEPKYLKPVISTFIWAFPHAFQSVVASPDTSVTLRIFGISGGDWTLVSKESGWVLFEGKTPTPEATITIEDDLAWRMFTRSIEAETARTSVTIDGDTKLAEPIFEMVSIIA